MRRLKQLVLRQLAAIDHVVHVIEERAWESIGTGLEGLEPPPNVELVLLPRLEQEAVVEHVERHGLERVISLADRGLVLAARVREHLGMPGNSVAVEARVSHKGLTRQRLREHGLSRVRALVTDLERLPTDVHALPLPVIVKPASFGAGLCVELIETLEQLPPYIARCRANRVLGARDELVLEEYLPGPELTVEGMVTHGCVELLAVTESHTSGAPYFVETGCDVFTDHELAPRLHAFATDVVRCLELDDCPFQVELKLVGEGLEVIEAHSRFGGGLRMALVEHATGARVFSQYVERLAGASPRSLPPAARAVYALRSLCVPSGVVERAWIDPAITEDARVLSWALDVAAGDTIAAELSPLSEVGHVCFRAADRADARRFHALVERGFTARLRA